MPQAEINVPISLKKQKRSGKKTAKKLIKKYDRIRREKTYQKLVDTREKRKKQKKIELIDEIKDAAAKKNNRIVAKKILDKCKRMKRPKKKFLVDEEDIETIDYDEPEEAIIRGESILEAANKVLDFDEFKKQQQGAIDNFNDNLFDNAETTDCVDQAKEEIFRGENITESANKILDFEEFKKQQEAALTILIKAFSIKLA